MQDELTVADLPVRGEIPRELAGVYMRNGPNPAYPPISYTYPFDGDGMIHALRLADGRAAHRTTASCSPPACGPSAAPGAPSTAG